jgi:hypothetical protein
MLLWGLVGALVGRSKGQPGGGFLLGVLLGPIGVLIAALVSPKTDALERAQARGGMKKCPYCAEMVKGDAVVCRYCGRDVPAAGWKPDPRGRHQLRYWDGSRWTSHVADAGVQADDPLNA